MTTETHPDARRYGALNVTALTPPKPGLTLHDCAIVVDGALYCIGQPVVPWYAPKGFDGYVTDEVRIIEEDRKLGGEHGRTIRGPRYGKRGSTVARQIVVHHSGGDGPTPAQMYHTLWYDRGLSVQFAVEDTGLIYQFLDAHAVAWHAGSVNRTSVGIEAALFPLHSQDPTYYERGGGNRGNLPHEHRRQVLQGVAREVNQMPAPQVQALVALCAGLWRVQRLRYGNSFQGKQFEGPPRFPRDASGNIPYGVVKGASSHAGLVGHLHLTSNKWDPAGLDLAAFEQSVAAQLARE